MKCNIIKDEEGGIIGFDLEAGACAEEELFVSNLGRNLYRGRARIGVVDNKLIIANAEEGTESFDIPFGSLEIIKMYLIDKSTQNDIKVQGFGLTACIRFLNEPIRVRSLSIESNKGVV